VPPPDRRGDREEDEKSRIFHFLVGGVQKGILKTVKFTTQRSGLFDVALYRGASSGGAALHAGTIVPGKFSVKMTLVGSPFFQLGQMIFIDTKLVDGGYFAKENLYFGGYYVIVGVNNYFGPDKWETSIDAVLNIPDYTARKQLAIQGVIEPFDMLPVSVRRRLEASGQTEATREALLNNQTFLRDIGAEDAAIIDFVENISGQSETDMNKTLSLLGINTEPAVAINWRARFEKPEDD
jgi:hypothetical protein